MKKFIIFLITGILLISSLQGFSKNTASAAAKPNVTFIIDGKAYATPKGEPEPYINKENRTMVSIRFFAEAIGLTDKEIIWDKDAQTATLKHGSITAVITVGKAEMMVNGAEVTMDTKAEIRNSRLFIPVRYVVEALGVSLEWNNEKRQITITSKEVEQPKPKFTYRLPTDEEFIATHKKYCGVIEPCIFENGVLVSPPGAKVGPNGDIIFLSTYMTDFALENGKMLFDRSNGKSEDDFSYELKGTINPAINRQVRDVTKVLLDENHYVHVIHNNYEDNEKENSVFISFAKNYLYNRNGAHYFKFIFFENQFYDMREDWNNKIFSNEVSITLELGSLWHDFKPGEWSVPFYENKLRSALIAMFGEKNGDAIGDYVVGHYLKKRTKGQESYAGIKESKKFGTVQVDFVDDGSSAPLYFYFSGTW